MKLSIVIPNYNTEELLSLCLKSIVEQTKNLHYEIIIVDNASTYNVKNQILKFKNKQSLFSRKLENKSQISNLKLIQNKKNLGFAKACNQGIREAKGEYLLFLNSDTVILDKAIEKTVKIIRSNKDIDILGCKLLNRDRTIQPSAGFFPRLRQIFYMMFFLDDLPFLNLILKPYHQQSKFFYQKQQKVDWVTGAFLLVKKKVIEKIKGFDEDYFMYAEEVDFCYRAKLEGFKIIFNPEARIIHFKESSPKEKGILQKALIAEFKGLEIFFKKYKPAWEMPFLLFLLKTGAFLRLVIFGILLGDAQKRNIYRRILFLD